MSEIDEMASFAEEQLNEDEAVAREAAGLTECWVAEEPAIGVVLVDGEPLIEGHTVGLTAHIARHDPARVLAGVAAKRAVLSEWAAFSGILEGQALRGEPVDKVMAFQVRVLESVIRKLIAEWAGLQLLPFRCSLAPGSVLR